jgi:Amt family ammonium transporter
VEAHQLRTRLDDDDPGLALFYGGLVRQKNVLSTLMHSFFCAALISGVLDGYSLAFGADVGGWIGSTAYFGLFGILGTASARAPTIPQMLFVIYQATFAIITPALISGTFAERLRFPTLALYMLLWSTFLYSPLCHLGVGRRLDRGEDRRARLRRRHRRAHLASGVSAHRALSRQAPRLSRHRHAAAQPAVLGDRRVAPVGWVVRLQRWQSGLVQRARLHRIRQHAHGSGRGGARLDGRGVDPERQADDARRSFRRGGGARRGDAGRGIRLASLVSGILAGAVCYSAVSLKPTFGYDDALDVVGVHMVGGTLGALLTGVFAPKNVNPPIPTLTLGLDGGLLYGYPSLMVKQAIAIVATYVFCGLGTFLLLSVINAVIPLRPEVEDERMGLDLSQHSETAYS